MGSIDEQALRAAIEALEIEGTQAHNQLVQQQRDRRAAQERQEEIQQQQAEDRPILSPANWIESEYHAGPLARSIYDKIKERFIDICERNIHEVVLGGSIGWGKSYLGRALHLRSKYVLSRYANPHRAYRPMIETSPIVMLNLNVTAEKAKRAYFTEFRNTILATPYFVDEFPPQRGVINELRMPKNIISSFTGASKTAAESENLIFVLLDEINLYDDVEKSRRSDAGDRYDEATEVHSAALRRQQSRFMLPDGTMPEPCFLISMCKETYPDSFIRRRINDIRKQGLDADVEQPDGTVRKATAVVYEDAEWETKPPDFYEKKYFWITTAVRENDAQIITDERRASDARKKIRRLVADGVEADEVPELIRVPLAGGNYLRAAKENLPEFIRDICGRPTEALQQYFRNRKLLVARARKKGDAFLWTRAGKTPVLIPEQALLHPYTEESTDFRDGVRLVSERVAEFELVPRDNTTPYKRWRPLVAPNAPRFVHVDMGLSGDAAGVCICCPAGWVNRTVVITSGDRIGEQRTQLEPVIWIDLMLRVVPPPAGQIQFSDIRQVVLDFQRLGFRFTHGSADGFQSANLLQDFEGMGMNTEVVSVDMSTEPYNNLRDLYTRDLIQTYPHEIYEEEMRKLERKVSKQLYRGMVRTYEVIDHPQRGTKDVSDGVSGATWNAYRYARDEAVVAPSPSPMARERPMLKSGHKKQLDERTMVRTGQLEKLFDMRRGR